MKEYTFSKGTVEKYDIRWNRGEWAVFTIDNASGLMQCHSSYGDWGYSWPNHGRKSFKHFILELERDYEYLLGKVSDRVFDFNESIKRWKKIILESRKEYYCEKDAAREAYDFIKKLDESEGEHCYIRMMENSTIRNLEPDAWEVFYPERTWASQDIVFAKTIWHMLCDIIRKELETDKKSAHTEHEGRMYE